MSQQALWSGRFDGEMDDSTLDFTSSLDVDVMLSFYDVMGSLAHVRMLKKCNIIPAEDADRIIEGLKTIVAEMESGELPLDEMMKRFEEGRRLVAFCTKELEAIRQRIDQVTSAVPPTVEPMDILKS